MCRKGMSILKTQMFKINVPAQDKEQKIDFSASDIETDAPLFREGLGLDSIDALELGLAVKKRFNVTMKAESEEMRAHFYSVATLADYIISKRSDLITKD